ncbi:ASCH domain-containing protein [Micavibrio aeruginosavorus]|uniref:ASCH domain-containing protein n=1 Tax=Micavibrio aeruginosavorus TaxID=349221 RepID=UPI003F4ACA48
MNRQQNPCLRLAVKREYFEQIKAGTKTEEYRLNNEYWQKRLAGKVYGRVVITLGYPPKGDTQKTLTFDWAGYVEKTITHPHFGAEPVEVFAINLNSPA